MKKRGISYTEILMSVALFSVGIVPLLLSFNSSYDTINFNKDLAAGLEYNQQMIEEIGSLLPLEVTLASYDDLAAEDGGSNLEEDVRELVEARSEDRVKGIYSMVEWNGGSFNFAEGNKVDSKYYREIEIGEVIEEDPRESRNEEKAITLPVMITTRKTSDSSEIVVSELSIRLNKIEEGTGEEETDPVEETPEPTYGVLEEGTLNFDPGDNQWKQIEQEIKLNTKEIGNKLRLTFEGDETTLGRINAVELQGVYTWEWNNMSLVEDSNKKHVYEIEKTILNESTLIIRTTLKWNSSAGNNLSETYEVVNSPN